jgi:holo-[acyl-carrier protein] synthase
VCSGVDRVELSHFERVLQTGGDTFLAKVFTADEIDYCQGRLDRLAARFAAKEATTKALGTGIRRMSLSEIEVVSHESGKPRLRLSGRAAERAGVLGITSLDVSLTHTSLVAEAFVVALTSSSPARDNPDKEAAP